MTILFHIGFHKTGSTWLQQKYFSNSSNFNLINNSVEPWKDILIKNIVSNTSDDININELSQSFKSLCIPNKINVVSAERLSGHPISGGYDALSIANNLYTLYPKAKILIVKRDAISFTKSVYKQMIVEGYAGTANEFLSGNNWKTCGPKQQYFLQDKTIRTYEGIFGAENVLTLGFENFVSNKKEFINDIEQFLNIKTKFNDNLHEEVINRTFSNKRLKALRLLNVFRKTEINRFPAINLGDFLTIKASRIISILFSNSPIIKDKTVQAFFSNK